MNPKVNRGEVERLRTQVAELERLLEAREQAALAQSVQTESVVKRVNGHAEALRAIASGTAAATGDEFFRSLVANLASALKVRYIYIGTLREPGRDRIATLAAWVNGGLQGNIEYDLAGTPCEQVVTQGLRYYCHGVQQLFPQDHFLVEMGVESYCGTPLLDRSGRVLGLLDVLHDQPMGPMDEIGPIISIFADRAVAELERKRAEKALRESEEKYRLLFSTAMDTVVLLDVETYRILDVNDAAVRTYGYSRDEFLRMTALDLSAEPDDTVAAIQQASKVGWAYVPLRWHKKKDSMLFPLEIASGTFAWEGRPVMCAFLRDITERKRLEEHLRQSQKMEAIGRLAGGVAHDFNNLLTVINGYSKLLLRDLEADNVCREPVEEIMKAGDRAATLTSQLLAFSRRQIVQPRALDLNQVVTNLVKMLSSLIGENIRLITALEPTPCLVKIDPGQLDQLLMNLALNARDAMLDGGTLTIETAAVPGETMASLGLAELAPGPYVRLAVRDTGSGMDAETKSHIFEPFFTTKEQGKGTGLGLAMVYGIVAQNGGTITVDSAPGQETTFTIYLPRVSGAVGVVGQPDAPADPASRAETVLLVEDEPIVRKFVRDRLTSQGYQVLEAASGEEALQRAGQHQGPIHLLLTDVVMPGMNGRRLAEQIVAARPETKVLFMSGYTDDIVIRHGFQDIDTAFLQKPFELTALYHKVRELLDGPQGRHER